MVGSVLAAAYGAYLCIPLAVAVAITLTLGSLITSILAAGFLLLFGAAAAVCLTIAAVCWTFMAAAARIRQATSAPRPHVAIPPTCASLVQPSEPADEADADDAASTITLLEGLSEAAEYADDESESIASEPDDACATPRLLPVLLPLASRASASPALSFHSAASRYASPEQPHTPAHPHRPAAPASACAVRSSAESELWAALHPSASSGSHAGSHGSGSGGGSEADDDASGPDSEDSEGEGERFHVFSRGSRTGGPSSGGAPPSSGCCLLPAKPLPPPPQGPAGASPCAQPPATPPQPPAAVRTGPGLHSLRWGRWQEEWEEWSPLGTPRARTCCPAFEAVAEEPAAGLGAADGGAAGEPDPESELDNSPITAPAPAMLAAAPGRYQPPLERSFRSLLAAQPLVSLGGGCGAASELVALRGGAGGGSVVAVRRRLARAGGANDGPFERGVMALQAARPCPFLEASLGFAVRQDSLQAFSTAAPGPSLAEELDAALLSTPPDRLHPRLLLPAPRLRAIAACALRALAHLHAAGLAHGRISPHCLRSADPASPTATPAPASPSPSDYSALAGPRLVLVGLHRATAIAPVSDPASAACCAPASPASPAASAPAAPWAPGASGWASAARVGLSRGAFLAPELAAGGQLRPRGASAAGDVWALGMVLAAAAVWAGDEGALLCLGGGRLGLPACVPPGLAALVGWMTAADSADRPSAEAALEAGFVRGVGAADLLRL
ncbi:hypothetical protein HYH03_018954 [Edaphochlamys debaryana]|uniref:Protein kinase domain-containing protein n=1 Tax=Edaphochlamys debaryana TaxID=47281 RepID=A0A836BNY9_9CHLO|nr:hypothetical protein HYH03_018954 [Edaphochlamys debaryana]|eukprot:KAG2482098.1 hypothetical protein HYH03_018954 [Edaphochlamys debaryana]